MHSIVKRLLDVKTSSAWSLLNRGALQLIRDAVTTKVIEEGQLQQVKDLILSRPFLQAFSSPSESGFESVMDKIDLYQEHAEFAKLILLMQLEKSWMEFSCMMTS